MILFFNCQVASFSWGCWSIRCNILFTIYCYGWCLSCSSIRANIFSRCSKVSILTSIPVYSSFISIFLCAGMSVSYLFYRLLPFIFVYSWLLLNRDATILFGYDLLVWSHDCEESVTHIFILCKSLTSFHNWRNQMAEPVHLLQKVFADLFCCFGCLWISIEILSVTCSWFCHLLTFKHNLLVQILRKLFLDSVNISAICVVAIFEWKRNF